MSHKVGTLSGSLSIFGNVELTGSLLGTASWAVSSSQSATSSYIDVTGENLTINWVGSQLQLTASSAQVIISDSAPSTSLSEGSLWWDSITGVMSVLYNDGDSVQWVEANYGGTINSSSFASTSSYFAMNNYGDINYADDSAAAAAGIPLGGLYRSGNFVQVRIS